MFLQSSKMLEPGFFSWGKRESTLSHLIFVAWMPGYLVALGEKCFSLKSWGKMCLLMLAGSMRIRPSSLAAPQPALLYWRSNRHDCINPSTYNHQSMEKHGRDADLPMYLALLTPITLYFNADAFNIMDLKDEALGLRHRLKVPLLRNLLPPKTTIPIILKLSFKYNKSYSWCLFQLFKAQNKNEERKRAFARPLIIYLIVSHMISHTDRGWHMKNKGILCQSKILYWNIPSYKDIVPPRF